MNKDTLNHLIERYYNGETSLDEEKALSDYYGEGQDIKQSDIHHHQFVYFRSMKVETIDQKLNEKLRFLPLAEKNQKITFILRIAAALILGIGVSWWLLKRDTDALHRITTNINEKTNLILPDGSKVWLNERSSLSFRNTFGTEKREVHLAGEAFFEIVSNTANPFVIHTGKVTTQVVGTSFNLRSYPEERHLELNVITGKVIFGAGEKVNVSHGEQAVFDSQEEKMKIIERIDPNAIAWKTKQLIFEDALTRKVINDIARYFHAHIEVETPEILDCHFSAKFNDPKLEEVLKVLSYGLNIEYTIKDKKYFIKGQNCNLK